MRRPLLTSLLPLLLLAVLLPAPVLAQTGEAPPPAPGTPGFEPSPDLADLPPLISYSIDHSRWLFPESTDTTTAESTTQFAHDLPAPFVVLARDDLFADSLSASVLLEDHILLFTDGESLQPELTAEVTRLLGEAGGQVYLLGGPAAISDDVVAQLEAEGHTADRLAGDTRIETSLAIADLAVTLGPVTAIALARATGPEPTAEWADSIAAATWSADTGTPILLTTTDELHPAVAAWLDDHPEIETTYLLGGEAALSADVEASVPGAERIAGDNRFATAVAVKDDLYRFSLYAFVIIPADHPDGWGYALAGAGYAVEARASVLLVGTDVLPAETDARTCGNGTRARLVFPGDDVSAEVRDALTADC